MEHLLAALRAVAEPTRLRLLVLCARGELTVSELTQILGQSQPRVSRHLKLLCEAGLLDRFREGSWVFYRLSQAGAGGRPGAPARRRLRRDRPDDRARPAAAGAIKRQRAELAAPISARMPRNGTAFARSTSTNARSRRRSSRFSPRPTRAICSISAPAPAASSRSWRRASSTRSASTSRARCCRSRGSISSGPGSRTARSGSATCTSWPLPDASFDAVVIHQVLHYADRPAAAIAEAARVLRPGGDPVVVDFAPHALEFLRDEHAHRRLGFADAEVADWCRAAGLDPEPPQQLPGDPLTVVIWTAQRRASADPRFAPGLQAERRRRSSKGSFTDAELADAARPARRRPGQRFRRRPAAHLVRVLSAEDPGDGGAAVGRDQAARTAAARALSR